jgi:Tub family
LKDAYYEGKSMDSKRPDDRLMMRAKKPYYKKINRTLSLNFNGRVKMASRKNI